MLATDWTLFYDPLLSARMPALPGAGAMQLARHIIWACVLGGGGLVLTRRLGSGWRLLAATVLVAWVLVPGPMSPTYWLSLAFQTPSLVSAAWCLWLGLGVQRRAGADTTRRNPALQRILTLWTLAGVLLGWTLLLDTFAVWPVSVYAWGYGTSALAAVALLAGAPCLSAATAWKASLVAGLVLAVYVLTRLPSGNLWDALLDPWLWLALQLCMLLRGVKWIRARRVVAATRA